MKKYQKNILLTLLIIFIIITILVLTQLTTSFDKAIYQFIISFRTSYLDTYFKFITKLGNLKTVALILIISFLLLKKKSFFTIFSNTTFSVIINTIIKNIIRRKRPTILRLIKQGGFSYPSGHAMICISLYGTILYLIITKVKNKFIKICSTILILIIIISIGISRIYLGVHYTTDIIAGYILAISLQLVVTYYINKHYRGI